MDSPGELAARAAAYKMAFAEQCAADVVDGGTYSVSPFLGGACAVEAFVLDRYPVTVERYRTFMDAGGYARRDLWHPDGWAWRVAADIWAPRFFDDPQWAHYLTPERPVVGVSWYEADAFCRFEGAALPSEAQWEVAARGPKGWDYPWGPAWEPGRVGNRGVGARCTWPVGLFAQARGPFGHHDLVGNVWQWTTGLSPNGTYYVRGGSWASRDDQCRNDYRNAYAPDGRWSHVGFRTLRAA